MDSSFNNNPQLSIKRVVYNQEMLNHAVQYHKPKSSFYKNVIGKCGAECKPGKFITRTIPIFDWLLHYNWKRDLVSDIIAGLTIAVMHIPQGMAYAMLANVPPVVGLYMGLFPVLVYFIFGTSRHISMGTFAIICLMTGKLVNTYSSYNIPDNLSIVHNLSAIESSHQILIMEKSSIFSPIEVATAVTLMTGAIHLLMYIFRLGIISTLLSETLVNGFISASAIHVVTSQIKDLLGIKITKSNSFFIIIDTYMQVFNQLSSVNLAALTISLITIVILVINNEFLKPWISKKSIFPVPIELIVVIIGTLLSNYIDLPHIYNISTVGHIPTGFPVPEMPRIDIMGKVALESCTIAIVSYALSLSVALMFAQQLSYQVDPNQELLAMGLGNIVGSMFSCVPFSASLSRSSIQKTVGGKTQLASVVSAAILVIVLLWIGPFFEQLPKCILASIIVVALKSMLIQAKELVRFWKLSKFDASIWIITFLACVLFDVDIGLFIGVMISLAVIFVQGIRPYACMLGAVPETDLYLDINRYKGALELPGIKIFHYCGGLNFASRTYFKSELYRQVNMDPQKEYARRRKLSKNTVVPTISIIHNNATTLEDFKNKKNIDMDDPNRIQFVIIDFSALSYIDPSGVGTVLSICEDFSKINVIVLVAGCSGRVYEVFIKCIALNKIDNSNNILKVYPTVHDAVQSAKSLGRLFYVDLEERNVIKL